MDATRVERIALFHIEGSGQLCEKQFYLNSIGRLAYLVVQLTHCGLGPESLACLWWCLTSDPLRWSTSPSAVGRKPSSQSGSQLLPKKTIEVFFQTLFMLKAYVWVLTMTYQLH